MKTVGLLALGGAMGLKFEDLSYKTLQTAFSNVSNGMETKSEMREQSPTTFSGYRSQALIPYFCMSF